MDAAGKKCEKRAGPGGNIGRSAIEASTQAPDGRWYPTVVRRFTANLIGGKTEDMILRFYYDFEADIPDSLFEP